MNKKIIFVLLTIIHLEVSAMYRGGSAENPNPSISYLLNNRVIDQNDINRWKRQKGDNWTEHISTETVPVAKLLSAYYHNNWNRINVGVHLKKEGKNTGYQPLSIDFHQKDFKNLKVKNNLEVEVISVKDSGAIIHYCRIKNKSLNPIIRPSFFLVGLLFGTTLLGGVIGFIAGRRTAS